MPQVIYVIRHLQNHLSTPKKNCKNREGYSMSTFLIRAGCVLALVGTLLLSGAEDLLPLELWAWMHEVSADREYFRVGPVEDHRFIEFIILGVGIAFVAAGWILRRKRNAGA